VPTISTRYIKTNVSVTNRATVVLGGLITRTGGSSVSGIPLVSRLPVLGYFFKNTSKKNDRAELIVLIRPVVSTSPFEVGENSKVEQDRLLIEPNLDVMIDKSAPRPRPTPNSVNFRYQETKEMK
jgi:type II secretory pathway component GspD/PulD (secretin)